MQSLLKGHRHTWGPHRPLPEEPHVCVALHAFTQEWKQVVRLPRLGLQRELQTGKK
jgi:hypothetical protein